MPVVMTTHGCIEDGGQDAKGEGVGGSDPESVEEFHGVVFVSASMVAPHQPSVSMGVGGRGE